jgi:hypothetical protein
MAAAPAIPARPINFFAQFGMAVPFVRGLEPADYSAGVVAGVSDFSELASETGKKSGAFSSLNFIELARSRADIDRNCSQGEPEVCNASRLHR